MFCQENSLKLHCPHHSVLKKSDQKPIEVPTVCLLVQIRLSGHRSHSSDVLSVHIAAVTVQIPVNYVEITIPGG